VLSTVYALAFYLAGTLFAVGLVWRIAVYARTPAPLKIPTMPAPTTRRGVVIRMIREVVLFESLFKANKWIWILAWIFHASLLLAFIRHLRYVQEPVWWWVALLQPLGIYAGFAMIVGLIGLWIRRLMVERIRYISAPSDHLMLVLLLGIGITGLMTNYVARTDVIQLKGFVLGLMYFDWQPLPADFTLLAHLTLVLALMIVFPISKLLHAPGVFFSPSRNQVDNARDKRHVTTWAKDVG